jgi:hypothetical protein
MAKTLATSKLFETRESPQKSMVGAEPFLSLVLLQVIRSSSSTQLFVNDSAVLRSSDAN